jgi:hypothetical protein
LAAKVETTVALRGIALVLVVRKRMATHLVLVVQRAKPMPVVAVVAIGVVGPRARRISTEQELLATRVAAADQVIQALTLRLFSMFRE